MLQDVQDVSADCIKILDLDARLLSMNGGGRRVMDVEDFKACRNLPWKNFWHGEARMRVQDALVRARAGRRATFEGAATTFKGTLKWWEVTVAPLLDEHGRVQQLVAVSRDVTDRKTAQTQLEELNAVLEHRIQHRTHDLDLERSALDAFVTFAEAAGTTADIPELARHALDVLRAQFENASAAYYEPDGELWRARGRRTCVMTCNPQSGVPAALPLFAKAVRARDAVFEDAWDPSISRRGSPTSTVRAAFTRCSCMERWWDC